MKFVDKPLSLKEIKFIGDKYGEYIKVTVDIERKVLVAGCKLHADGEKILIEKNSRQDDIWGGGISLGTKEIDSTAVLNIRPILNNSSLEILDPKRRKKLINTVTRLFAKLWD